MPSAACKKVPAAAGIRWSLLPPPLRELLLLSEEELARQDIAVVNLACAEGLPGTEHLNAVLCLERLDAWADAVRRFTGQVWPRFRRNPAKYHHSEGHFRALALVTCLQRRLGVRYNPAKIGIDVPFNAADCLIHGVLQGEGGTCATLPVVYIAVGRRLGYPLKLVSAQTKDCGHSFVRWDDPAGERFNIETTGSGLACPPDDYYRTGKYAVAPDVEQESGYLKSKTPREELAGFLNEHGWIWVEHGRYRRGIDALVWANVMAPKNLLYLRSIARAMGQWHEEIGRRVPPGFPPVMLYPYDRLYPDSLPEKIENDILHLEAVDTLLRDPVAEQRYWGPMRRGVRLAQKPCEIIVEHEAGSFHVGIDVVPAC